MRGEIDLLTPLTLRIILETQLILNGYSCSKGVDQMSDNELIVRHTVLSTLMEKAEKEQEIKAASMRSL